MSAKDLELVIISGLYRLTGLTALSLGSNTGCSTMTWSVVIAGVSWTGGSPKDALGFLTLGSLVILGGGVGGGVESRLGVSTTGGLPKVARGLRFGAGEAGVVVGGVVGRVGVGLSVGFTVGGLVCRGGGSCVGIR